MATAAVLAPHDVPTTLNYYTPADPSSDESPYIYVQDPPEGKAKNNIGHEPHPVVVQDVRGREHEFTLDKGGFQFVKHVSQEKEFDDEERIKNVYYKEVEELLKKEVGAKRVLIFDHTIRLKPEALQGEEKIRRGPVVRDLSFINRLRARG